MSPKSFVPEWRARPGLKPEEARQRLRNERVRMATMLRELLLMAVLLVVVLISAKV